MSPVRKLFVAALLAGILLPTFAAASPFNVYGGWYWPFVNYRMYSIPHHMGDEVVFLRLEGLPCDDGDPVALDHTDLGLQWFPFQYLLEGVLETRADTLAEPSRRLRDVLRERYEDGVCTARLYERRIEIGRLPPGGLADAPWRVGAKLPID